MKLLECIKRNKDNIITFIIIFILTLAIFHDFVTMHYATDTYNIINRGYKEYAITYSLNDGRPIMCIISLIADFLNIPIQIYIIGLTVIALLISCISVIIIKNIVMKYMKIQNIKTEIMVLIASYVVIFNFAYLENLQFAECAVMAASILLHILAAKILLDKPSKYYIKSLILVILAVLCYQGTVSFLITFLFVLSLLKEKAINKQVIKDVIISGIWIIIGIVINLVQVRISGYFIGMTQTRMGSISNIPTNIKYILENLSYILKNTYELFPKYAMLTYIGILVILNVISIKNIKDILKVMNVVCIILVAITTTFIPNLLTLAAFGTGRMSFSIGAMIGLIFIYMLTNMEANQKINYIIGIVLITYVILTITNYVYIMNEHKKVNIQDKQECETIGEWIEEYEKTNGVEIKNVVMVQNEYSKVFYDNINNKSALCYRALYTEWSRIGVLNYYTNRNFKEIETKEEEYYQYFYGKNWKELNEEQLLFKGDTLYYCIY